jgi:hypothetical protein
VEVYFGTPDSSIVEDYKELVDSAYSALESHVQMLKQHGVLGYRKKLIKIIRYQK